MAGSPLIPANDQEQRSALAPSRGPGTAPAAVLDEVGCLPAKPFDARLAWVALVEQGRGWFKASRGLAGARRVARTEGGRLVATLPGATAVHPDLRAEPCQPTEPGVAAALAAIG